MTQITYISDLRPTWHIYAIVADGGKEFAVKIGVTTNPYDRYNTLRTGIPFKSVMLYSPVGEKRKAFKLERALHKAFADRNTQGEWFSFSLEDKAEFHNATKLKYLEHVGKSLAWDQVTLEAVNAYLVEIEVRKRAAAGRKKRRKRYDRIHNR